MSQAGRIHVGRHRRPKARALNRHRTPSLAIRSLRATPVVTAVAILSLALGIGANSAVFSLLDSVAPKSLPIADPDRLVRLSGVNGGRRTVQPRRVYGPGNDADPKVGADWLRRAAGNKFYYRDAA